MAGEHAQEEMMREIVRLREELLRKEEELSRTENRLSGLLRIKDRFLSLATHDIRTPITTLKLIANVVERSVNQLPDLLQRTVGTLPRNVAKLEAKVDDLVRIARLDGDDFVPKLEPTDWNKQAQSAIAACFAGAVQREIELDMNLNPVPTVMANAEHIRQMMIDLIRTSMDRLDMRGHLIVESGADDENSPNPGAWFLVQDNGPAFADSHVDLLQQDLDASRQEARVRVPLFLAHRVAVAHGGVIEIGRGAPDGMHLRAWVPLEPDQRNKDKSAQPQEQVQELPPQEQQPPTVSPEVKRG